MLKNKSIGVEQFKIASYQMDEKGNASLTALAGIFQEIAGNHAHANGFGFKQMIKNGHIWVLTRFKMEIYKFPLWGEKINVSTWIVNREKFFSRRDFQIHNENNELSVSASSGWMLLNMKTKRPKLVDALEMDIPMQPDKLAINAGLTKINALDFSETKADYTVRYSDLDVNRHVNNVKYMRMFLDGYSYDWRRSKSPKSFEINYLAEAAIDDELEIVTGKAIGKHNTVVQEIIRKKDNKIICRAKVEWV